MVDRHCDACQEAHQERQRSAGPSLRSNQGVEREVNQRDAARADEDRHWECRGMVKWGEAMRRNKFAGLTKYFNFD